MLPKSKPISSLSMTNFYYEKIETQRALYQLLKILATSEDDSKRDNAAEAIALMIAQEPLEKRIKYKLSKGQLRFYSRAIEDTQMAVINGIVSFPSTYNWNITDIDENNQVELKRLESNFVSWVGKIIYRKCIIEYRKTDEGKEARRKKEEEKRGEKIERRANRNSKYQEAALDRSFGHASSEKIITLEQKIYADIEGNFVGEIGKDTHSLDGLDSLIAKEQAKQKPLAQWVKEYIEQDLHNKLKDSHPRGQKQCNCQVLLGVYYELLRPYNKRPTMDKVYERLEHTGCTLGTIRNWLTNHKAEKSQNRPSCIKLMQQIIQEEYDR